MINIHIPGKGEYLLKSAFFDLNGTLAVDGIMKSSTRQLLEILSEKLDVNIITADTFGVAEKLFKDMNVNLIKLNSENGSKEKEDIISRNNFENIVAFGNGYNDHLMLAKAKLSIIVLQEEGLSIKSLKNADILVKDIDDGINLLLNKKRLIATLRR